MVQIENLRSLKSLYCLSLHGESPSTSRVPHEI